MSDCSSHKCVGCQLKYYHHVRTRFNDSEVSEKKRRADMCQAGMGREQKSELSSELQLPLIHLPRCTTSNIFQWHSFLRSTSCLFCFVEGSARIPSLRSDLEARSPLWVEWWLLVGRSYLKQNISPLPLRPAILIFHFFPKLELKSKGRCSGFSAPALFKVEVPRGWLAWDTAASLKV